MGQLQMPACPVCPFLHALSLGSVRAHGKPGCLSLLGPWSSDSKHFPEAGQSSVFQILKRQSPGPVTVGEAERLPRAPPVEARPLLEVTS